MRLLQAAPGCHAAEVTVGMKTGHFRGSRQLVWKALSPCTRVGTGASGTRMR